MKERPIIFSAPIIKGILDNTCTQTRRVIKPQPFKGAWNATAEHPSYGWFWKKLYQTGDGEDDFFKRLLSQCPYGQVGDRLWVRETWAEFYLSGLVYKADNTPAGAVAKWRPSIHMFKKDTRIWLEITEVRVERVQEISWRDCKREGVETKKAPFSVFDEPWKDAFERLWDSLNAKRGYGWEVNPWVWVLSFKVV